jgi:hypothetical protein
MKIIIPILLLTIISFSLEKDSRDEILEKDGISKGAIEFLKEHDAYEDVLDAFYSDSLDYIN